MKKVLISVLLTAILSLTASGEPSSRLNPPSRLKRSKRLTMPSTTTRSSRSSKAGGENLCHNGGLDQEGDPLNGWMTDYGWSGHSTYKSNGSRCRALPSHDGRKGILHVDGRRAETLVECLPIPFEKGARYRCTIDYKATCGPHIYFKGYKWQPGVRPYRDKPIHIGDLRGIYRSSWRNHNVSKLSNGWKRESFEFPMENASELSLKHLRYVRFITVYFMVINDGKGEAWIDNVVVQRIK